MKYLFQFIFILLVLGTVIAWRINQGVGDNSSSASIAAGGKSKIVAQQFPEETNEFPDADIESSSDDAIIELPTPSWLEADDNVDTIPNEWLMQFASKQEMEEAIRLARAAGIQVIGQIDALNAIRLRATTPDQRRALAQIGAQADELGSNYFVRLPAPPPETDNSVATGNAGFGPTTMDFLGMPSDHSAFGEGVTIAMLDTGIDSSHPAFSNANIQTFSLLDNPIGADPSGHGTAVASLIIGADGSAQGVAPAAPLLSYQVMGADGTSDSFTIAQGIVQAVDAGAKVITFSLGSYGNSPVLENAVNYALSHQIALVAAAGNDGFNQLAYPARYNGVVGVAAIDAHAKLAYFSNYGNAVDIAAPGIQIYSAGEQNTIVGFSGTSASTPLVAASIAVLLSEQPHLSPLNAASYLLEHTNDAGAPGKDPHYGHGILNIERFRKSNPGYDVAISDFYIDADRSNPNALSLKISVQNRGTKFLSGIKLDYILEGRHESAYLGNLNTNKTAYHEILLNSFNITHGDGTILQSKVTHDRDEDVSPENNLRANWIYAKPQP